MDYFGLGYLTLTYGNNQHGVQCNDKSGTDGSLQVSNKNLKKIAQAIIILILESFLCFLYVISHTSKDKRFDKKKNCGLHAVYLKSYKGCLQRCVEFYSKINIKVSISGNKIKLIASSFFVLK